MAQLKDLLVAGPGRVLNDLYVQSSIYVTNGIKIGSAYELKSFGTGLSLSSAGVLSCVNGGTVTSVGITNGGGIGVSGSPITGSGSITISNAGVRAVSINGNYLRVNTNGTNADLTISYATAAGSAASLTGNIGVSQINSFTSSVQAAFSSSDPILYTGDGTIGLNYSSGLTLSGSNLVVNFAGNGSATTVARSDHSHTNMVTGSSLTSGYFVVGNGSSAVKISSMYPSTSSTTWSTSSDVYVPTMKAISSYVTGLGYTSNTGTVTSVTIAAGPGITVDNAAAITTSGTRTISAHAGKGIIVDNTGINVLCDSPLYIDDDDDSKLKLAYSTGLTVTSGGALAVSFGTTGSTVAYGNHTHTNMVTGSGLTANEFVVGNGSSSIKTATVATIKTKLGLGSLAYVSPSTSGTATTLFLGYSQDDGTYSLMDPSSDHLVTQVNSNSNVAYRVLLSYSNSDSTQVNLTYKNSGLTFNPSTGILSSAKIETGSAATSYFQSQRFRGEGDAATYYHAVDFGYASHDRVDFYEYGGIFCFHKHTAAAVGSGDTVLGTITANGWEGNVVGNVTGTASGNALASHTHGYITNIGALGSNASVSSVATGDALVIVDASDSSKISYLGATLNTTHGGSFLRRDGTWAVPPATSGVTAIRQNNGTGTEYTNVKLTFSGATINMSNNVVLVTIDGTCLIEGTKILMADNTEKNIEDVVEGDLIMSYDPNTESMCEAIVVANLGTGVSDDFVNYYFDDGSFVTIFGKHCLYNSDMGTARGVDFWEPGWKCINSSGEEITYIGSEDVTHAGRKRHFDLRSSNMLYFANGVLNANALTANNMLVKRSGFEFPQSYLDAIQEDADSSARLNTFKFDKTIGSRLVPILKELREQKKILDDNKKLLADTDYIVAKFTEGLISTVEWLKTKADRAGWRTLVNKAEEAYNTAKARYDAFKDQYKPTSTHRERFNAAVARDNACLEALKAHYANHK